MTWRYRLACWLGFHRWTYPPERLYDPDTGERCCLRCGRRRQPSDATCSSGCRRCAATTAGPTTARYTLKLFCLGKSRPLR